MNKVLKALGRIGLVLAFPVWFPLMCLFLMLLAFTCWFWGVLRWIGTGEPVMKTAEDLWIRCGS